MESAMPLRLAAFCPCVPLGVDHSVLFSEYLRVLWPWQALSVLGQALSPVCLAQGMPPQGHPPLLTVALEETPEL